MNIYKFLFKEEDGIIVFGNSQYKEVVLTFDDGPSNKYTPQILKILDRYNIKACFFMVGKEVKKYESIAKEVAAQSHEIGNHTYSHRMLYLLPQKKIYEEIKKAEDIITEVTSNKLVYFRPPRGLYNNRVKKIIREEGYKFILWNLSSHDWINKNPKSIEKRCVKYVKNGTIFLFHDSGGLINGNNGSRLHTVKVLPTIIEKIQEKGYKFVTLSELIDKL